MASPNCKNWCFTKFWDPAEPLNAKEWLQHLWDSGVLTYLVAQVEMAPETERVHIQGFMQCGSKHRMTWLKRNLDADAHWEPMRGTAEQARDYCKKDDSRLDGPWEWGTLTTKGRTAGLETAIELIKARATDSAIAEAAPRVWVSHYRGLQELRRALKITAEQRSAPPEIWILWGPSGTGKSRFASEHWPDAYWKAPNNVWWDGYWGQETVVLDDFSGRTLTLTDCQRLMDPYPLMVEIKGGMVPMVAKRLVFTSNWHPRDWYAAKDVHQTIMRRVHDWSDAQGHFFYVAGPDDWRNGETMEPVTVPVFQGFGNTSETSEPHPDDAVD